MKAATAYRRGNRIFLHASSKTTAGVWILDQPVAGVAGDDADAVGAAAHASLAGSREGVAHPTAWGALFDPVLALAGVKTFATFIKGAKCVEIEADDDIIRLIPTRNEGIDEGFNPLHDRTQTIAGDDPALGAAVLAALDAAE